MKKYLDILEKYYGYRSFRRGQEEIIKSIVDGCDTLAIMPTGGGKSVCYQVPALGFLGATIVISPLISLMKDQVDALRVSGVSAVFVNSALSQAEFNSAIENIKGNKYKLIYVAPERLESSEFLMAISQIEVSQVAVDEAHCVSAWGHDFRSSYRRIAYFIEKLRVRPVVTAFTATATEEVKEDIIKLLKLREPKVFITGFDRENLSIEIIKGSNKNKYIDEFIKENKEDSGIIYCATRKQVESLYGILEKRGYSPLKYHGGMGDEERKNNQEAFINDENLIMIATNAFGMGIDKPNIRYVIHYNMPKNIEGYYQEIGRAGRDSMPSKCVLLFSPSDVMTQKYLIDIGIENEERKIVQYKKLQQMRDLIYSNSCYKEYILKYFGEKEVKPCNNCSNCLFEGEVIDKTIDAQKVISCVFKMKKPFGTTMIIDVLRGSKNQKLTSFNFHKLSTYGIMKEYSKDDLKNFMNTLISHGYLDVIEGTYPVVGLSNLSYKIAKGEEKVFFKEEKVKKRVRDNNALFEILRDIRSQLAGEFKIPPYMVFGDNTLKEMSLSYPITKEEFLNISGVGQLKYEKFGESFLSAIGEYVEENNIGKSKKEEDEKSESLEHLFVETDPRLLEALKEVRKTIAKKERTGEGRLLSLQSLKEISGRKPLTEEEFLDISGIGPKKVESLFIPFKNEIEKFIEMNNLDRKWEDKEKRKVIIDGDFRSVQEIVIDELIDGKTLNEVLENYEVPISSQLGYVTENIEEFGQNNFNINPSDFYTEDEKSEILSAIFKVGEKSVGDIKKLVSREIKYDAIRAVILERVINRI